MFTNLHTEDTTPNVKKKKDKRRVIMYIIRLVLFQSFLIEIWQNELPRDSYITTRLLLGYVT